MDTTIVIAVLAGVAIAAAAGLRAFLPLFVIGLAGRFGPVGLDPRVEWMTTDLALVCLGVATLVEVLGDKIPVVDHALDVAGTFLRPLTASFAAYALLLDLPAPWAQIIALACGGGALAIHLLKAHLRLATSALTSGVGNPVVSTMEDVAAVALAAAALLAPFLGLALLLTFVLVWRKSRARRHGEPGPAGGDPLER